MEMYIQLAAVLLIVAAVAVITFGVMYSYSTYKKLTADDIEIVMLWDKSMRECVGWLDIYITCTVVFFIHYYLVATFL